MRGFLYIISVGYDGTGMHVMAAGNGHLPSADFVMSGAIDIMASIVTLADSHSLMYSSSNNT